MTPPISSPTYLHGFSGTEQQRLMTQARLLESSIFGQIDYSGARRLLEVGSGVGAQTEILLRRFPELHVTGVDLSETQLATARENLARTPWCSDRYTCSRPTPASCRSRRAASTRRSCAGCWSTCRHRRAC
jgi:hypothetical protein